jgi:hypothetical protein
VVDVYLAGEFEMAVAFGAVVICKRARSRVAGLRIKERFYLFKLSRNVLCICFSSVNNIVTYLFAIKSYEQK